MDLKPHKPTINAYAKLNLSLHITGKREDNYHLLHALTVLTDIHDVIEVQPADRLSLKVEGETSAALDGGSDENIIIKAVKLLAHVANIEPNIAISLQKNIPVGAGLGGGSADAAAIMRLLVKRWNINLSDEKLQEMALTLGADVSFCYGAKAAIMEDIGQKLTPVESVEGVWAVLVNPNLPLSTQQVYHMRANHFTNMSDIPPVKCWQSKAELFDYVRHCHNDLQASAIKIMPKIEQILALLSAQEAAVLARMSGSGATCFALFNSKEAADKAMLEISRENPTWWVKATALKF